MTEILADVKESEKSKLNKQEADAVNTINDFLKNSTNDDLWTKDVN